MSSRWTPAAIRCLGVTTDQPALACILGVSTWKAGKMAQSGQREQAGIRIGRIGARYRVAVQPILEALGYSDPAGPGPEHESAAPDGPPNAGNEHGNAVAEPSCPAAARGRP